MVAFKARWSRSLKPTRKLSSTILKGNLRFLAMTITLKPAQLSAVRKIGICSIKRLPAAWAPIANRRIVIDWRRRILVVLPRIGESDEKFSLLCGFSPFDDGWYCASANVSTSGKSRGWSKLHDTELHRSQSLCASTWGRQSWRRPPAQRSLAICGANSALEKTGATIPGANSVPTKMCEPTAGDKNAQRKIGSSARKSKRKNYRTIPQRRDISMDVRQVRRRPLVRVTRPVQ